MDGDGRREEARREGGEGREERWEEGGSDEGRARARVMLAIEIKDLVK